ncbi:MULTISPECIES: hypothetical protein [unclassified Neisseria]|uniref:LEM-3-like GIY-YIG domain-containing protein n=1 Tax=unclassified Neisseria TaxID=2623750 RepID=UPI0026658CD3|nr:MULTISPECIES: hypothetical protein [unclassified Neisseria]MDO1510133.1 hypothetical protein [Neisseria sp. MVDL19-042950]MDO1516709.1 hypothetical protein [Neisseria sp. MVDL18-041461]
MFSTAVCEQIKYYIYCLVDPRDNNIFYVGKGIGNRVFHHARCALTEPAQTSDKLDLIREIYSECQTPPNYYILRHGIEDELSALQYEATAIDLLSLVKPGQKPLTNIQGGTYSSTKGLMDLAEIKRIYAPEELKTALPVMLITINREYDRLKKQIKAGEISDTERDNEIYKRTRAAWKTGIRRNQAKYAVAVYRGWSVAAYRIHHWMPSEIKGRWAFDGTALPNDSAEYQELVHKITYPSIENYKAPQNPIQYLNC